MSEGWNRQQENIQELSDEASQVFAPALSIAASSRVPLIAPQPNLPVAAAAGVAAAIAAPVGSVVPTPSPPTGAEDDAALAATVIRSSSNSAPTTTTTPLPATTSNRRTSAVGPWLIDLFERKVPISINNTISSAKNPFNLFAPPKILFEYCKFLVHLIEESHQPASRLKQTRALVGVIDLALGQKTTVSAWDPSFVDTVIDILSQHHQEVSSEAAGPSKKILEKLREIQDIQSLKIMASNNPFNPIGTASDPMAALVAGIAGRMSLGDDTTQGSQIAMILAELGPSCTRTAGTFCEVLQDVARTHGGPLNEQALAALIFFCSSKQGSSSHDETPSWQQQHDGTIGLSSALLGSIIMGRGVGAGAGGASSSVGGSGQEGVLSGSINGGWNLDAVAQVLNEDYGATRDWVAVARSWDFPSFQVRDAQQFRALVELYRSGAQSNPPLAAFTTQWLNTSGQLSALEALMSVPTSFFAIPLDEEETADLAVSPQPSPATAPNPRCWASMEILHRLLYLSDMPSLYRRVRDLFVRCLLACPEVLLCSLVRLQLRAANLQRETGSDAVVNAGMQIKTELMRELIPAFFRPNSAGRVQNGPAAIRRLYAISPTTVMAACFEAWRSMLADRPAVRVAGILHIIHIARLLPHPAEAVAGLLSGSRDAEYSIAVAFIMADHDYLQMKPWLGEKLSSENSVGTFAVALVSYLRKNYLSAAPRKSAQAVDAPLISYENLVLSLQLLQAVGPNILSQTVSGGERSVASGVSLGENVRTLIEACLSAHPSIRGSLTVQQQPELRGPSPSSSTSSVASAPASNASSTVGLTGASDDVDEMATEIFQKIYTSEQSIGEVVEMLKRFKTSGDTKENEIFACMVHNLFDEYRFFNKYPEKELRITGILFGTLIQEQLVSGITLGIALRYVLEALRKPPSPPGSTTSSGKMFQFGMFALEQFKTRLHEWPQYCSHIVQIGHLKEGYSDLVAEIEHEMSKNQQSRTTQQQQARPQPQPEQAIPPQQAVYKESSNAYSNASDQGSVYSNSSNASPRPQEPPAVVVEAAKPLQPRAVAQFGQKLGRAVSEADDERPTTAPPDAVLDRVQFLVNNLAPSNVELKATELRTMLDPQHFGWLGHFLVVKRISTQANFHSLYLSFLDHLGEYGKGLVEAILSSVYHNIGKLLRSPKITTSSSERGYLKNLGIWLGQITLSRNRPILQIMLDCKELLLQGYETGKLIAVAPFLAKTLEGAKNSIVFRPPNPWLMGLLAVFRAVYDVEGLKMNIKFEVEVLCKNLGIKLEDIPVRKDLLSKRIAPIKERNPDFNIKNAPPPATAKATARIALPSPEGPSPAVSGVEEGRTTPVGPDHGAPPAAAPSDTVIPNLAAYVTVNPNLPQLLQQSSPGSTNSSVVLSHLTAASLKRWVPLAVDRAIREIIQPVVERSVTISCITTKEMVTKDFAMEPDETKMRKAAQLMVAHLAGSLALVTCREPLRSSISTHLRQMLTNQVGRSSGGNTDSLGEQEHNLIEQSVQICATENLELGCRLIEKAATEKAVRDVDEALAPALSARRSHRELTGQPYYDMSIYSNSGINSQRYPAALPDPLRPKPGGMRPEHLTLYESFARSSNTSLRQAAMGTGGARAGSVGPQYNRAKPDDAVAMGVGIKASQSTANQQQPLSTELLTSVAAKLDAAVTALLNAARSHAAEIKLSMVPSEHQIRQLLDAMKQIMPNADAAGGVQRTMTVQEQELVLSFAQGIFKRLYELSLSEPLRLESLVAVLENINIYCPKLGRDLGTWATYAPSNTEAQRRLHKTVLLLLVRSRLVSVQDLDTFLSARADQGRDHVWFEFSFLFIRTAFLENIAAPTDFPKLMDLMQRLVEGRSQATAQVAQTYRKAVLLMLEDAVHRAPGISGGRLQPSRSSQAAAALPSLQQQQLELSASTASTATVAATDLSFDESSSLSLTTLSKLLSAGKQIAESYAAFSSRDHPASRQQVTALLDAWIRVQTSESALTDNKTVSQYMVALQQFGVGGKSEEQTERFFRLSALIVVQAALKTAGTPVSKLSTSSSPSMNFAFIDVYAKLLQLLVRHMNTGGTAEQVDGQRLGVLNKILGVIVRSMVWHAHESSVKSAVGDKNGLGRTSGAWDQRPWFRLLLNLLVDLNKPDPELEPIRLGIQSVFGAALHVVQPLVLPGFAFSWLELVAHRHFLPNLLLSPGRKAWHIAHELLVDLLLFLEPYLRRLELTPAVRKLYDGTLRVLLVLLHDFPSFLSAYHLSLCNVIPENCIQLRNIVLSATPKGVSPPDPFTPNLKIDLLPEILQAPAVRSNVMGPIESMRPHLDAYLKEGQRGATGVGARNFLSGILSMLYKEGTTEVDTPRVNSLVLYVGAHALDRLQQSNSQLSLSHTPEIELILKLMELDDRGRYICLNAIANQLRFPSSHTRYFSCVMLYLFSETKSVAVKEQVTRVLLERLIVHRPHPWGLLITFIELIKNQRYAFWSYPFTRCATEIEKVFESVARSCMPPGAMRSALVGGDDQ